MKLTVDQSRETMRRHVRRWVLQEWQQHHHEHASADAFAEVYAAMIPNRFRDVQHQPLPISATDIADWLREPQA